MKIKNHPEVGGRDLFDFSFYYKVVGAKGLRSLGAHDNGGIEQFEADRLPRIVEDRLPAAIRVSRSQVLGPLVAASNILVISEPINNRGEIDPEGKVVISEGQLPEPLLWQPAKDGGVTKLNEYLGFMVGMDPVRDPERQQEMLNALARELDAMFTQFVPAP